MAPHAPPKNFAFYKAVIDETLEGWNRNNVLRLSAALAYYSVFSIAPLLLIAIFVAGRVLGPDAVRGQLEGQLSGIMGSAPAKAVQSLVQTSAKPSQSIGAAVIGAITLLLGASGVFSELKEALNSIFQAPAQVAAGFKDKILSFLLGRLLTFGMVLCIGFLLLISLLLTTAVTVTEKYAGNLLPMSAFVTGVVGLVVAVGLEVVLFALIFQLLPNIRVRWRDAARGATITAILFEVGKWVLGLYLGRASTTSSFGAAGSLVLILLWVYYTSLILFTGAEFTRAYALVRDRDSRDKPGSPPADSKIKTSNA